MLNSEERAQVNRTASVDDSKAAQFDWGSIQWLCSGEMLDDAEQTFGFVQIFAGANNPEHLHPNSDEVLYLLEGELDHSLGDAMFRIKPGMTIHIPRGVPHNAVNVSDVTAKMLVTYPTENRQAEFLREEDIGKE